MANTIIKTNMRSLNSHRNMKASSVHQARSSQRLASGLRLNSAADDAAGMGISEKMRSQVRSLDQATRNCQDAISLIQTADGALGTINDMAVRIRELMIQAANDTNNYNEENPDWSDRARIQDEIDQLLDEIDNVALRSEFNSMKLLDGSFGSAAGDGLWFQIGAMSGHGVHATIEGMDTETLDLRNPALTVMLPSGEIISREILRLDSALAHVNMERGSLGAVQNRLEHAIENLEVASENLSEANSRIADADMAKEIMVLTQANVSQEAAQAMKAQANQAPQNILQLLAP